MASSISLPLRTGSTCLTLSESLWSQAYNDFKTREPKLSEAYERELSRDDSEFSSQEQIGDAIKQRLDKREAKQFIVKIAGRSVKIREYGEKIIKFVVWSKDFISAAARAEPHAALACAGVSLILPLLLDPSEQNDAMFKGLERIASLIQIYKIRETSYLESGMHAGFRAAVVQLYSQILEYQARMICHLSKKTITRVFKHIQRAGQWDHLLQAVNISDRDCLAYATIINEKAEYDRWMELCSKMERSYKVDQQILEVLSELTAERESRAALSDRTEMDSETSQMKQDRENRRRLMETFASSYTDGKDINPKRVAGTCEWFLEDDKFRSWRNSNASSLLWVSADPGCGKSVLSKCLVDERLVNNTVMASTICYFFFKDGQAGQMTAANAITAILHQTFIQNPDTSLIRHALPRFNNHGKSLTTAYGELWNILMDINRDPSAGEIVCIVDALDECGEKDREKLIDSLVTFYGDENLGMNPGHRLKILVTSRPYDDIEAEFMPLERQLCSNSSATSYVHFDADEKSDKISKEINLYIDDRIPRIAYKLKPQDQTEVANHLKNMQHRTYLWLYLIFKFIKKRISGHGTEKRVKALIEQLPDSVNNVYEQILSKTKNSEMAREAFQIILAAKRPLTVSEMNIALTLSTRSCNSYYELESDLESDTSFQSSLKNICGLLVSIIGGKVYLLHQTVREFLIRDTGLNNPPSPGWKHSINLQDGDERLYRACVSVLLMRDFDRRSYRQGNGFFWASHADIERYCLLIYASSFWATHYLSVLDRNDENDIRAAVRLCNTNSAQYQNWFMIFRDYNRRHDSILSYSGAEADTDLITASALGFYPVVRKLLQDGADVTETSFGRTALYAASDLGYYQVVEQLLTANANVDLSFQDVNTSLLIASENGHHKVVSLLVSNGATGDSQAKWFFETALFRAAGNGHDKVVAALLEANPDFDLLDRNSHTALDVASANGHVEVVKILLAKGAAIGNMDRCSLVLAIINGQEKVIELLLANKANVDFRVAFGTALRTSSRDGREKFVRMLLAEDADINLQNELGDTALMLALRGGHHAIAQMLLPAVTNVNLQNKSRETALMLASRGGHDTIAQMLLPAVANVNLQNKSRETALMLASRGGHDAIAQMILPAVANVNLQNKSGDTALMLASRGGHNAIAQMLLPAGANISLQNKSRETALMLASRNGHDKFVVKLLVNEASVDTTGTWGWTALIEACERGYEKVVRLLLAEGADVNIRDSDGDTPFDHALRRGHHEIVKLLLAKAASIEIPGNGDRPPGTVRDDSPQPHSHH